MFCLISNSGDTDSQATVSSQYMIIIWQYMALVGTVSVE